MTGPHPKATPSREAARAAGLSDEAVAALLKEEGEAVGRSTVNAWHLGRKAIPRRHAKTLAALKPKGIPLASWSRILD